MSDYISRGEVRAKLTQYLSTHVYIVLPHIQKIVNDIPTADVRENIHGEWIFDEILYKHYYCSECKSMGVDYWDYCPYCGADMREVSK